MDGFIIAAAFLLDIVLGDPSRLPHPVRFIGRSIESLESFFRGFARTPAREKAAGIILVLTIVGASYAVVHALLVLCGYFSRLLAILFSVLLAWTTLATKSLAQAAGEVYQPLANGDRVVARNKLSMIVGRDTQELPERDIVRATVETIAENASDGVIAPLFYLALGGPALAMAYKAVNTLDSMIGHRNERYRNFGWAAARLDDVANFIPARITGALICFAAALRAPRSALFSAWRIMLRDGAKHPSPNSGWPEAAMAGALGVRLGGTSAYGGIPSTRPYLGENIRELEAVDIPRSVRLLFLVSLLGVIASATTRFCVS